MDAMTESGRGQDKSGHTARAVDPVVTEIVRNGLIAVTEEMKINLMRTAYNLSLIHI